MLSTWYLVPGRCLCIQEVAELVCHASLEPKTPDQCEKHYMGVYLNSAASPLPDLSALVHGPDGAALTPEEAKARREAEKQTQVESGS